jgi:aspartate beta-hydroxylase
MSHILVSHIVPLLGGWAVCIVSVDGIIQPCSEKCPTLLALLQRHPCILAKELFGACIVSVLRSGGVIHPHCGPVNFKLRLQYPLTETDQCSLSCGDEKEEYGDGYSIIDDSYRHHARNDGANTRIVLVMDVWHPNVTVEERPAIVQLLAMSRV